MDFDLKSFIIHNLGIHNLGIHNLGIHNSGIHNCVFTIIGCFIALNVEMFWYIAHLSDIQL